MPDELNSTPTPDPTPAPAPTPPAVVDDAVLEQYLKRKLGDDVENPLGFLKAARAKAAEVDGLKRQLGQYKSVVGEETDPLTLKSKLEQLNAAEKRAEEQQRLQAEADAKYQKELDEIRRLNQEQLKAKDDAIRKMRKDISFDQFYAASNGIGNVKDILRPSLDQFIEYDADGQMTGFKKIDGSKLYVTTDEGARLANASEFAEAVRRGDYGDPLARAFPPKNQSSGAGLPGSVALGDERMRFDSQEKYMAFLMDPKNADKTREIQRKLREGQIVIGS